MHGRWLRGPAAGLLALALSLAAAAARGHESGHSVLARPLVGGGVAMQFVLSSGEPLADASIRIDAPDGAVHLAGRSDRLGRAAFVPDRPGAWRLEITDRRGHTAVQQVEIGADLAIPRQSRWRHWLLRLSLLANLVLAGGLGLALGRGGGRRSGAALTGKEG